MKKKNGLKYIHILTIFIKGLEQNQVWDTSICTVIAYGIEDVLESDAYAVVLSVVY